MKKKLLIICDSHGTDWGCNGYANLIKKSLNRYWETKIIELPGMSIKKAIPAISGTPEIYDSILIGLGNPDIHPRIPRKFILTLRAAGITKARDSYFSIPPKFCTSYILRIPLFLLRIILIRIIPDFYLSLEDLEFEFRELIGKLSEKSKNILIIPTFRVDSRLYGKHHNMRSTEINKFLQKKFPQQLINLDKLTESQYEENYNKDLFHFKQGYQDQISLAIAKLIEEHQLKLPNETHSN
ncbi:hypothetical protein [Pseudomonas nitroreducens]|uniref:hypothetical protein n=1 Tax=Pseudomonas nitroreducens TaxID=46680 RepID=UPI001479F751|nr:hypothetical protein [Pseudomonas nitroreducens]NNN28144.1 hypothetical protein [Pseudomonas nitroreducens]